MKIINKLKLTKFCIYLLVAVSLASCSYRPIFDLNEKYKIAGETQAQKDADLCIKEADDHLKESKKRRIVKEGGRQAVWGSVFGAIFGFLIGGDTQGLITGTVAGAGIGAVAGAGGVASEDNLTPDQMKQRLVTNCLNRQGYQVIGWE